MPTRREFLRLAGGAGLALALPGCGASPPLRKGVFTDFGSPTRPYLGLATSLRAEHDYEARVEGAVPPELRGTLYRNGPGLFDRDGLRRRTVLDGDGMERHRTVGFHPPEEFIPELMLGIAQALVHSGNFSQALVYLDKILLNYSSSHASSQARQLRQVCLSKGAGR